MARIDRRTFPVGAAMALGTGPAGAADGAGLLRATRIAGIDCCGHRLPPLP